MYTIHKGPYSLKDLSKAVLGLSIQEGPHSALHDALATMALIATKVGRECTDVEERQVAKFMTHSVDVARTSYQHRSRLCLYSASSLESRIQK